MHKHEISDRKKAKIALNRLAAIVESSDDAIISKDLNGIITSWNKGAEKIFGYTAEEMVGGSILQLFPPERHAEEEEIMAKIVRGEKVSHYETLRRTKQGELIDVSVAVSPIRDADGQIIGASKIARDSTERKAHEQEILRLSRLYAALSQINQAIVMTRNREELFEKICRVLVEPGEFSMSWIAQTDTETGQVLPVAQWGDESDYLSQMEKYIDDGPKDQVPVRRAICEDAPVICNSLDKIPDACPVEALMDLAGFQSMAAFPIHLGDAVWGAVIVYSNEINYFREKEISLLKEAAGDISFALDFIKQDEQRRQAEADLRESDERYRALFERSLDAVFLNDFNGKITEANRAALDLIGYQREDIQSLTFNSLLSEDQLPLAYQITEEIKTNGSQKHPAEFRLRCKDGRQVYVETRSSLIYREGKPYAILGIARDLTESKQAAAALVKSEKTFRELVQNMPFALVEHGPDTEVLYANPMACRLLDMELDQMLGKTVTDPVWRFVREDGSDLPVDDYPVNRTLRADGGVISDLLVGIRQREGDDIFWVQCSGHTIRDQEGVIQQVVITFADLTERKRVEMAQIRLATAVEQSAEAIFVTDTSRKIVYVNPAFEKISGYTQEEVIGENPTILKSSKHEPLFYRQIWETLQTGEAWQGHITIACKHNEHYDVEAIISPVRDAAGKVVNYVAGLRDVTREMQLESQFRQSQKMEAFGQLAGGVAHDFNNILMVIQMQAGLLKSETNLSSEQNELAGEIENAAERAADLTRQLLLFSRKQTMQAREIELNEMLKNITKMLKRTLGEQIQLELRFAGIPLHIKADPGMIDQILLNLAVNARDAMPKGGEIFIETTAAEFDELTAAQTLKGRPGRFACMSVSDTGEGIAPENLSRIFEPFFTTKEVGKGTGLGLATVYGIVEQHQGWINAYSEVNLGTTFRVYLPLLDVSSESENSQTSRLKMQGGDETILLVEDESAVRSSMKIALSRLGYQVLEAATGKEALAVWELRHEEIQIVLTDLVMPGGMNGVELGEKLRQKHPELKIIYASGYSAEILDEDFQLEEGVNFLAKPFNAHKLARTVRGCLDKTV